MLYIAFCNCILLSLFHRYIILPTRSVGLVTYNYIYPETKSKAAYET